MIIYLSIPKFRPQEKIMFVEPGLTAYCDREIETKLCFCEAAL